MLVTRSSEEARLYLEVHACDCGEEQFDPRHWLDQRGDDLVAVYEGECPNCGRTRRYEFRLDKQMPGQFPSFGTGVSQILDAGEFLWAASTRLATIPVDLNLLPAERWPAAMLDTRYGIAAVTEAAKFLVDGADELPDTAVVGQRGRDLRRARPRLFTRAGLQDRLDLLSSLLANLEYFDPRQPGGAPKG